MSVIIPLSQRTFAYSSTHMATPTVLPCTRQLPLDPNNPCRYLKPIYLCIRLLLIPIDFILFLTTKYLSRQKQPSSYNVLGKRTPLQRSNSLHRQNSLQLLRSSISDESHHFSTIYYYSGYYDLFDAQFTSIIITAQAKNMEWLLSKDPNPTETANSLVNAVKRMKQRAKKSIKFRFLFKQLISFFTIFETSRASTITAFIHQIAQEINSRNLLWFAKFLHKYFRCKTVPSNVYETSFAIFSLFAQEGGIMGHHYLANSHNRTQFYKASAAFLGVFAIEQCSSSSNLEINITKFTGIHRTLFTTNHTKYKAILSPWSTKTTDVHLQKDRLLIEICLNGYMDYIETTWSVSHLQRAIWTFKNPVNTSIAPLYSHLEQLHGQSNIDLTNIKPHILLIFCISGAIRLCGENDSVYKALSSLDATVFIQGKFPSPSVHDLHNLEVVERLKTNWYRFNTLPGIQTLFSIERKHGDLFLVETKSRKRFQAQLSEWVH